MNTFPPNGVVLHMKQFVYGYSHIIRGKQLLVESIQILLVLPIQLGISHVFKVNFVVLIEAVGIVYYSSLKDTLLSVG